MRRFLLAVLFLGLSASGLLQVGCVKHERAHEEAREIEDWEVNVEIPD